MITKEMFLLRCEKLFPEYDFSKINWVDYNTPITVICQKHGEFIITPKKLYQQRGRCAKCRSIIISEKNKENATNRLSKAKATNLKRYGVENPFQSKEIQTKMHKTQKERFGGIGIGSPLLAEKIRHTKLERYGNATYTNRDKNKETVLSRYGVSNISQLNETQTKKIQTSIAHYGVSNPLQSKQIQQKVQNTCKERYGVNCIFQRSDIRINCNSKEARAKRRETLHRNNTYGKSKAEDRCYTRLVELFSSTKRSYSSEKYPFLCDLYVPELDLYIELNFFWTHGGHFFEATNPKDIAKVEEWKLKNTKFYDNAIQNWTVRDLEKLQCAIDNNLNYLVCWSEKEFMFIFDRDFSCDRDYPQLNNKNISMIAKIANWEEYFKREIVYLQDRENLGKLFINRYQYLHKLPHQLSNMELLNGVSISGKLRKYSTFDVSGMIEFIEKYHPQTIYDPCAGWGERLLTCYEYNIPYFGIDINNKVVQGQNQLISDYQMNNTVICGDSSKQSFTSDCLFTCPPYWNTEIYTDIGSENLSYEDFLLWWSSVIQKANCNLIAYQINQKYKDDMNKVICNCGYQFIEEIKLNQRSSHFTHNRKTEYESVQIFRKIL